MFGLMAVLKRSRPRRKVISMRKAVQLEDSELRRDDEAFPDGLGELCAQTGRSRRAERTEGVSPPVGTAGGLAQSPSGWENLSRGRWPAAVGGVFKFCGGAGCSVRSTSAKSCSGGSPSGRLEWRRPTAITAGSSTTMPRSARGRSFEPPWNTLASIWQPCDGLAREIGAKG